MSEPNHAAAVSSYYSSPIDEFLSSTDDSVLGQMTAHGQFALDIEQRNAWQSQLSILRSCLGGLDGYLLIEFDVPRLGSRIDVVVIIGAAVIPIEFKVGERAFERAHYNQAWDYALDLKNFHRASHEAPIFPVLLATESTESDQEWSAPHHDLVFPPARSNPLGLRPLIDQARSLASGASIDGASWGRSEYHPTPTIIEAARRLYSRHTVDAITRSDAGAKNLRVTSRRVEEIIEEVRAAGHKAIVFVTGVPGAGKTLVGLSVATNKRSKAEPTHAVFLSGNGPLVAVLREALTRDEVSRVKTAGRFVRKGDVATKVQAFIQNVHHFRDDGLKRTTAPFEHVAIFDEAQRAWDLEQTRQFMKQKKGRPDFGQSEPEFLLSVMDRRDDWAVVVCLVGGGQEINKGEAGISLWIDAVRERFPEWAVYVSPELTDSEYAAGHALDAVEGRAGLRKEPSLHLATSMRSFRAERLSGFVKAVLDCDRDGARALFASLAQRYPLALTRDLFVAKEWIRTHARGNERFGLVASSQAQRLKPHAIDVRVQVNPVHWFLNDASDTRSSYYLEDAATEFDIQGLELDWVCMTWDADLRFNASEWTYHAFRGSEWTTIRKAERRQYLLNAYRVLLTRARQGMVIFVPPGTKADPTRDPAYYNDTWRFLADLGIAQL
ncbi:MAG: DUF2075 domain-containing protein [Gemmatimonadota bacterium]|nr:DUF2075 domain-containing protein [Gemmatimonadota bacterium]